MRFLSAHMRSTVMCGPGNWPHSSVSTAVIARIPFVAARISVGVRPGPGPPPPPPGSLRMEIVPPVKRITTIARDRTAAYDYRPGAVGGPAVGCVPGQIVRAILLLPRRGDSTESLLGKIVGRVRVLAS